MPGLSVIDGRLAEAQSIAGELRPRLGPHPVPQSDPRTRGLLIEVGPTGAERVRLASESPGLGALLAVGGRRGTSMVIAINETPPTNADSFLLRPHFDRRYRPDGFEATSRPERTTIIFLDFPRSGIGGELVVFPDDALPALGELGRARARAECERLGAHLIAPVPGRVCLLDGELAHAVLGYETPAPAPAPANWRMVAVVAEFAATTPT